MLIKNITLTNYRNHLSKTLEFDPEVNFIVGPNAAGKTNILEAIHMLSTTKSFRAKYDRDIVNFEKDYARISGFVQKEGESVELEIFTQKHPEYENASTKTFKLNKVPKRASSYIGNFYTVLFSPEDMEMFASSPSSRRKVFDLILYQTDSEYKDLHIDYLKAVRIRNKILEKIRKIGKGHDEIGFWNTKVVQNGTKIASKRAILINTLNFDLGTIADNINKDGTVLQIQYKPKEVSFDKLHDNFHKELAAGTTLYGPHRDEYTMAINGRDILNFGSRGQQRSAIIALKLAELEYIHKNFNIRPTLLLDDIFSELDDAHEKALIETIKSQQTIITSTDKKLEILSQAKIFEI